jgi:hypothetical protein
MHAGDSMLAGVSAGRQSAVTAAHPALFCRAHLKNARGFF